jgi:hypothetical protein
MFIFTCFYVDSHVQHDIWMTQRISEQQDETSNRKHTTGENK